MGAEVWLTHSTPAPAACPGLLGGQANSGTRRTGAVWPEGVAEECGADPGLVGSTWRVRGRSVRVRGSSTHGPSRQREEEKRECRAHPAHPFPQPNQRALPLFPPDAQEKQFKVRAPVSLRADCLPPAHIAWGAGCGSGLAAACGARELGPCSTERARRRRPEAQLSRVLPFQAARLSSGRATLARVTGVSLDWPCWEWSALSDALAPLP